MCNVVKPKPRDQRTKQGLLHFLSFPFQKYRPQFTSIFHCRMHAFWSTCRM